MTVLEQFLLVFFVASVLLLLFPDATGGLRRLRQLIAVTACILLLLHPLIESTRWNLWGLYLVAPFVLWRSFRPIKQDGSFRRKVAPYAETLVVGLAAFVSALFLYMAPIPHWPAPSGAFSVGATTYHWVDASRDEIYGDAAGPREIVVQVWYPAPPEAVKNQTPEPWFQDGERMAQVVGERYGVRSFFMKPVQLARSHTYSEIEIAADAAPFPVLIYSHGWGSSRRIALDSIEHLVSHGYCVVAADHTYGALATSFPDGRLVPRDPKAMPPDKPDDARQVGIELLVKTFASDVQFTLEKLAMLNEENSAAPFSGLLDLNRVGLFGHSTGGGAVYRAALEGTQVRGVAGLDPWVEPIPAGMRPRGLKVPTLSLRSERWYTDMLENNAILGEILAAARGLVHDLVIDGTTHYDFSLIGHISPLMGMLGVTGPTPAPTTLKVINESLLSFFDEHVRGKTDNLLANVVENYPELVEADATGKGKLAADGPE